MRISQCFLFFVVASLFWSCSDSSAPERFSPLKGEYGESIKYENFLNPPVQYRSFPFYSLNDRLEPAELARQIEGFKEAGFGGFYLHSRVGLLTEYMGNEWWEAMDTAVQTAEKVGLQAWFYDEDKWPSGYAGGEIPKMGPGYRAKCLARLDADSQLPEGSELLKSDEQYNYICYTSKMGKPKFNGTSYVDLMNPEVVRSFLNVAHKKYIDRFKGKTSYKFGIFSDEPHIHARYYDSDIPNQGVASYSPGVRERFKEMFHYDLIDSVHHLFEETGMWRQTRLHFHQAVALQFEESFSKQVGEFCNQNETRFTGHYLGEDKLHKVRNRIGNSMLHYRNMHIPGMDHLGLTIYNRLITARSVSSVANQYGMPRRMSELFGITGHNMNFDDRRWIANWHIINGINHFVPHLSWYSMKGQRKRDYPPTFSYHQPYWPYNKDLEDYLGRMAYVSSTGKYMPQMLVLNPLESEYIRGNDQAHFTGSMLDLLELLQQNNYDYDLGDEQILFDIATVVGDVIKVGEMSYKAVMLPDMIGIRESTLNLLLKFAEAGGKIFHFEGRFPGYVDGNPMKEKLDKLKGVSDYISEEHFGADLQKYLKSNMSISGTGAENVWSHVRKTDNGNIVILSNVSHLDSVSFTFSSQLLNDNPVLWNPETGKTRALKPDDGGNFKLSLPHSSLVWITTGQLSGQAKPVGTYSVPEKSELVKKLDNKWSGERLSPNAVNLDFARYSTDGGETWSSPEPVIGIHERFTQEQYNGVLKLRFSVSINETPIQCDLVVEQPDMFNQITVNGKEVHFSDNQWFIDRQFPKGDVSDMLMEGQNDIELTLDYQAPQPTSYDQAERYGIEIESIYLAGDFAVKPEKWNVYHDSQRNNTGFMRKMPVFGFNNYILKGEQSSFDGNLTKEGYPFFAGEFKLSQNFDFELESGKRYYLTFPKTEAIVVIPELNGQSLGKHTRFPVDVEITDALKDGSNSLEIKFVNSLRNLMGPHHHVWKEMTRVGPSTFDGTGGFPSGGGNANWFDLRLTNPDDLISWRDEYYVIPFGLLDAPEIYSTGQ